MERRPRKKVRMQKESERCAAPASASSVNAHAHTHTDKQAHYIDDVWLGNWCHVCLCVCVLENVSVANDNLPICPNKHQSAMSRPELAWCMEVSVTVNFGDDLRNSDSDSHAKRHRARPLQKVQWRNLWVACHWWSGGTREGSHFVTGSAGTASYWVRILLVRQRGWGCDCIHSE